MRGGRREEGGERESVRIFRIIIIHWIATYGAIQSLGKMLEN
jgi:hypothetical protein